MTSHKFKIHKTLVVSVVEGILKSPLKLSLIDDQHSGNGMILTSAAKNIDACH
jgi:hypothetical protein